MTTGPGTGPTGHVTRLDGGLGADNTRARAQIRARAKYAQRKRSQRDNASILSLARRKEAPRRRR